MINNFKKTRILRVIFFVYLILAFGIVLAEFPTKEPNNHKFLEVTNSFLFPPTNNTGLFIKDGASITISPPEFLTGRNEEILIYARAEYLLNNITINVTCCSTTLCKENITILKERTTLNCTQFNKPVFLTTIVGGGGATLMYEGIFKNPISPSIAGNYTSGILYQGWGN